MRVGFSVVAGQEGPHTSEADATDCRREQGRPGVPRRKRRRRRRLRVRGRGVGGGEWWRGAELRRRPGGGAQERHGGSGSGRARWWTRVETWERFGVALLVPG
jgi:hypothetical protein